MSIPCRIEDSDALEAVRAQWNNSYTASRNALSEEGADPEFCKKQSRVVLILSASRSGSSWLAEMCASSTQFASLPGEIDPFLILALGQPDVSNGESDELEAWRLTPSVAEALSLQLSLFVGNGALVEEERLTPKRLFQSEMRVLLQWPELHEHMDEVRWVIRKAFQKTKELPWEIRMIHYLRYLKKILPHLNPYYYDLDPELVYDAFPEERIPAGPPNPSAVIEEPPFICESQWTTPSGRGAPQLPLIIKSPSNAYRLDFFRSLFSNAEITVIHVMRDPAACVTGLMCGWLHHGFFKHCTRPRILEIEGYTRSDQPWTAEWWKFDLPPGWTEYTHRRLEEVCRFQWISANEHILRWVQRNRKDIKYVQTSERMLTYDAALEMAQLFEKLGLQGDENSVNALMCNRRTMVSYGVSDERRAELRRIAMDITDCMRVRYIMDAYQDAGYSSVRKRVFIRPRIRARGLRSIA
jgi:hypothetical protein